MMHLVDETLKRRALSRRGFLGGATASAAAAILAACGGSTATDTPAAKPTTAPTTAAVGGAPTTVSGSAAAATRPASSVTGTTAATAPAAVATSASTTGSAAAPTTAASAAATGQGKPGGSILIGTLGEAKTINPFLANESEGDWRVKMLFDQLVRLKPDTFEPKAGLAKSWKIDGLTFTFTLQDAKFSDGSDLTADDVAFTMKGMLAKATASPHASKISSIQGAKEYTAGSATDVAGIKVVDAKTLAVTLAQPDSSFLINMRFVNPVPKKMLDGKDLTKDAFFQKPVGAGPFVFVSWQVGGDFVAQRNPNYYQKGLPYLDKFTHRTIPDAQSLVNSLLSGDIDGSNYPSPAGADKLKANKDLNVLVPPYSSPDGWTFNLKNPWLAKKEVRQAVAYCMDMTQFSKDSLYGLGKPGNGPIAPGNALFDPALKPYTYDLDKAKALIKAAGTPPSDVSFIVNKGNVLREDFLTLTQAQLQKAGWNIKAEAIEYAVATDKLTRKDYDVFGAGVDGATVDAGSLFDTFATTGSQNFSNYSNPQLDTLLTQAKQALTVDAQKPLYKQIQAIIQDDAPTYYAWYRPFLHAVKKKFAGYVDSADEGGIFYELEQWYVNG
ncbi:MAG: ABC transporter substrate-binding protein [Chloroflexota bacterium]|nr:ABC transporter substrate-binding protein [Chloroflexota bacterium]